jgi:redox-sensitive bicupin YhaK (pirin superfamily)
MSSAAASEDARAASASAVTPVVPAEGDSAAASTSGSESDAAAIAAGSPVVTVRPSASRGHANHGWLNTYHTFSFASYRDPRYESLHALRVLNEDRVAGGRGFGKHSHAEFEIASYVVSGVLKHSDSMGHEELLGRGSVQFTCAGTGIAHAEENGSEDEPVHFLQVWTKPNKARLAPAYKTKKWNDKDKTDKFALILSKDGRQDSIRLHADVNVLASILAPGRSVTYELKPGREIYVHLVQDAKGVDAEHNRTGLTVAGADGQLARGGNTNRGGKSSSNSSGGGSVPAVKLSGGDGALVHHSLDDTKGAASQTVVFTGAGIEGATAEFLLFDLKKE